MRIVCMGCVSLYMGLMLGPYTMRMPIWQGLTMGLPLWHAGPSPLPHTGTAIMAC